jgi:hypothetical protein
MSKASKIAAYHLEWFLVTFEDPQSCPILNPQKQPYFKPTKKTLFQTLTKSLSQHP